MNEKENLGKELEMLRSRLSSVEVQEWGRMVTEGNLEASGAEMLVPPSGHLQGGRCSKVGSKLATLFAGNQPASAFCFTPSFLGWQEMPLRLSL